jgi:drug/metabolite transporter (DMT)-like permease
MSSTADTLTPPRAAAVRRGVSLTDVLLVLMAMIWGANISVVKFGTTMLAPLAYNGVRVAIAAVALLAIAVAIRAPRPARHDVVALLLLGFLGNGVYQVLFIEGVARTRAGNASLVLAATPVFIALLSWMRGLERLSTRGFLGIAVSVAGVGFVVTAGETVAAGSSSLVGDALVLAGCLCWAIFTVFLKPYTHRVHAVHVAALTMLGGCLPLMVVSAPAIAAADWRHVPLLVWAAIVFSGMGALVIAYLLWYRGVRVLGPTRTSMYSNLQPVVGLLFAWVLLGEIPTGLQGAGAAAILTGLLMTRT